MFLKYLKFIKMYHVFTMDRKKVLELNKKLLSHIYAFLPTFSTFLEDELINDLPIIIFYFSIFGFLIFFFIYKKKNS